jgi:hypothetical protein
MRTLPAFLLMIFVVFTPQIQGQETESLQLPAQGDVRIIVDISGSMKANDPDNLRQPAVRLLARMLPEGTSAGVWTFGQWVNMLVPHGPVDEAWRQNAVEQSRKINSVALRTNLGEAIEKASDAFLSGENLGNTDFILLTDGMVDLSDDPAVNAAERQRILGPLLDRLTQRGATLHTVALSEEADLTMLEALAAETGGHFSLASSAEGLNRAFLKALNAAVPQDQIPLDEEGFTVDSGVEEFTALIFWGEDETSATRSLELINPDGASFSENSVAGNMRWAAETGYDLITVTEPAAGQWQVNGELGEGSRVTVVSDLRMVVSPVPPSFDKDEPISLKIAFFEEDSRIQNPDFLQVIEVIVRLTASDGRSGSKILNGAQPPENGVYVDEIESLPAAGDYDIEVIADGTTFSRRFSGVTRFIAPEIAEPAEPSAPLQESEPEAIAPESSEPATDGPIDLSAVEKPLENEMPATNEAPAADPETAADGMPIWVWGLAGGLGLVMIAGGAWFWWRRRHSDPAELTGEAEEEEGNSEESNNEEVPEMQSEEASEPPVVATEEEIPEPEPEPEPEEEIPELEPEPEPEQDPEPEPEEAAPEEDDEDEFGLEDFDLSEFDDLPESEKADSENENPESEKNQESDRESAIDDEPKDDKPKKGE